MVIGLASSLVVFPWLLFAGLFVLCGVGLMCLLFSGLLR